MPNSEPIPYLFQHAVVPWHLLEATHINFFTPTILGALLRRLFPGRPVRVDRATKSVGAERTFDRDLTGPVDLLAALDRVAEAAWVRVDRSGATGRTVTLKLRFTDFRTITRARSFAMPLADQAGFLAAGVSLLEAQLPVPSGVRLLGLTLSGILEDDEMEAEQEVLLL